MFTYLYILLITNKNTNKMKKVTKKQFCLTDKELNKLRKNDPIQFSVLFNEYKRKNNKF